MTTTTETPEDRTMRLEQLVIERTKLKAEQEAITERIKTIDAVLLKELEPGTHPIADVKVQIKRGTRRLNAKALTEAYPVLDYPGLYKATINTDAVKHELAPAVLEDFYTVGSPTVAVS